MRKLFVVLVLILLITGVIPAQAGVLPNIQAVYVNVLPSISSVLKRMPDMEEVIEDGSLRVTYQSVTVEDYDAFNEYLETCGCILTDYAVSGTGVCFTLEKDGTSFIFEYDIESLMAKFTYPAGFGEDRGWMAEAEEKVTVAEADAMAEARLMPYKTVGSYVTFGTYPQTESGKDDTPIEWLVLDYDEKNNKTLLISKYGLDCQPYNKGYTEVTWETCTLRTWLNSTFLKKAFSSAEQSAILTTNVGNSKKRGYTGWNTDSGNNTEDQIFLLSYSEASRYFDVTYNGRKSIKSFTAPTIYAIAHGAYTSSSDYTEEGWATGIWWLCSPGDKQDAAAVVNHDGFLNSQTVFYSIVMVRPAIWLDLSGI